MPSPQRLYRYASTPQIEAIIAAAIDRQTNGAFTNLSGGGHSSSRQFADDETLLREANCELSLRAGTLPPTHTTQDFSRLLVNNTTVNV